VTNDGRNHSIQHWGKNYEVAVRRYFDGIGDENEKNLFVSTADLCRNPGHFNG
jgi:hypothetical protein